MYNQVTGQILDYHRSMLTDTARTSRYQEAIERVVRPDDVVIDLGCGTGILALLACRAGAARVYAIEAAPVIEIARAVCRANKMDDRIAFVHDLSTRCQLPERCDVLVTETIGNLGFNEGILESVIDARRRLLKENARMVPQTVELILAPVELPAIYATLEAWSTDLLGFDYTPARRLATNVLHWVEVSSEACLAQPVPLGRFDLAQVTSPNLTARVSARITRSGTLHGLAGWFTVELADGITLNTAPPLGSSSWRHGFLPLAHPLSLEEGDQVEILLHAASSGAVWRWHVRCTRHDAAVGSEQLLASFDQSTFFAELLSPADLARRGLQHKPRLNERGMVDRFILEAMDGLRPLSEIATAAQAAFPGTFANASQALAHVQRLAQRDSR